LEHKKQVKKKRLSLASAKKEINLFRANFSHMTNPSRAINLRSKIKESDVFNLPASPFGAISHR